MTDSPSRRSRRGRRVLAAALAALAATVVTVGAATAADVSTLDPAKFGLTLFTSMPEPVDDPSQPSFQVKPQEFDPGRTQLVQSTWLPGIGCPTGAQIAIPNADFTGVAGFAAYTDPACPTGDASDRVHEGLLLVKTGPTANFASATAELTRVKGITVTSLGWDIRKQGGSASPLGSHCGAGAPRWNIITQTGSVRFIGCNSPPAEVQELGNGWTRMRWSAATLATAGLLSTDVVSRIQIVFDEGQDAGPDFFGAAILDNIAVNETMVGRGAVDAD